MPFRERLQALVDSLSGGNVSRFAKFCGLSESNIRMWINGPSKPSLDKAIQIVKACGVSLDWLFLDQEPEVREEPNTTLVARYSVKAPIESGVLVLSDNEGHEPVFRDLLMRLGLSEQQARFLRACGDSMLPTIADGDPLIVEASAGDIIDGRIYVFTIGDGAYVKRLRRGPGKLIMISDNPDWPTREEAIPPDEHFQLIGRVRWVGRTL